MKKIILMAFLISIYSFANLFYCKNSFQAIKKFDKK